MSKIFTKIFLLIFAYSVMILGQSYSGPEQGSVHNGVTVSTNSFSKVITITEPKEEKVRNILRYKDVEGELIPNNMPPAIQNYTEDKSLTGKSYDTAMTIVLKSLQGLTETNSIPPDPYVAVGPQHIVATVNSNFGIWDKEGNLLKTISADAWYQTALAGVSSFDPKILYDHFAKRWIMVWLHQNDNTQTSYFLVSVSQDSSAIGTWYNWALPSNMNGSTTVTNWGDYQGVGFDDKCLYITSNQFQFGGYFQYAKIRIINKDQLYANTAGQVVWNDIWNIKYPTLNQNVFNIRPAIMRDTASVYYLMHLPTFSAGSNFAVVYKIANASTTPTLTGGNIPISQYYNAPNADQLGGSIRNGTELLIEAGGSALRNEPKYQNGFLFATHSINNPSSFGYSALRYLILDPNNGVVVEDASFGAPGFWHYYSSLDVDKDNNIAINYSRSGVNEYAGAHFVTKLTTDPPGFTASKEIRTGRGNYIKDYSSGRNRWGDYNGVWVDPSDGYNMWMFTEFASNTNTWGTWLTNIRMVPFLGVAAHSDNLNLNFGNVEINNESDILSATLANFGDQDLVITAIPDSAGPFKLLDELTFPITLHSYDSLTIHFSFYPTVPGNFQVVYPVTSNDPSFNGFTLNARGYRIIPAESNVLYASTGSGNLGKLFKINTTTGASTEVGNLLSNDIKSIASNPITGVVYGLTSGITNSKIFRVNAAEGDANEFFTLTIPNLQSLAFDTAGTLYSVTRTGEIYRVYYEESDPTFGTADSLTKAKIPISNVCFNPLTNELWAAYYAVLGANKDKVYKIDLNNGDTLFVGKTGTGLLTNAIAFDKNGNLFGATGSS
ncbi:MAG: hypothetical protein ACM3O3_05295, partial [Syntrophothermus sp.]